MKSDNRNLLTGKRRSVFDRNLNSESNKQRNRINSIIQGTDSQRDIIDEHLHHTDTKGFIEEVTKRKWVDKDS